MSSHAWIEPAVIAAITAGDLVQAAHLVALLDDRTVAERPLLDAVQRCWASPWQVTLDELRAMIGAPASFASFDAYVAVFPGGERYRDWIAPEEQRGLRIIAGTGWHAGITGGYLWGHTMERADGIFVALNDCDDGLLVKRCATVDAARRELEDLCTLAPVSMGALMEAFGYHAE